MPRGSFIMHSCRSLSLVLALCAGVFAGCAARPINAPITEVNRNTGDRFQTRQLHDNDRENFVILAFSGGGTRAAAGTISDQSPEFQRLLRDTGARPVPKAPAPASPVHAAN
jgi:hypothetical protein